MKNDNINYFIKNGYFKIKLQKNKFIYLKKKIKDILKKEFNLKQIDLEKFHEKVQIKNLNNIYEIKFNKYKKEIIKLIIQQIKQDDKILKN